MVNRFFSIFAVSLSMGVMCIGQCRAADPQSNRALWIWNMKSIYSSTQNRDNLFTFLEAPRGDKSSAIKTLFCSGASPKELATPPEAASIRSFNSFAHSRGMTVYCLCGQPSYGQAEHEGEGLAYVSGVLDFNKSCTVAEKFDGLQFDVEPSGIEGWPSQKSISSFRKLFTDSRDLISKSGQHLLLSEALQMQCGYVTDSDTGQTVDLDVIGATDNVAIMSYRSTIPTLETGADLTLERASAAGKQCWVGVETNDVEPKSISFYGLGNSAMEKVLNGARTHFQKQHSFAGYAIEELEGYKSLKR